MLTHARTSAFRGRAARKARKPSLPSYRPKSDKTAIDYAIEFMVSMMAVIIFIIIYIAIRSY